MNDSIKRPGWSGDILNSILFFFILNVLTVISPFGLGLAPIILPAILLYILAAGGRKSFLLAGAAGVIPYIAAGSIAQAAAMVLPLVLMTAALYLIHRYQLGAGASIAAAFLGIFSGLLVNAYLSIYRIAGSTLEAFSAGIAQGVRTELLSALSNGTYEVPPSQAQAVRQLADTITPQFVQDLIPTLMFCWSVAAGYLALRFAGRLFRKGGQRLFQVPWFSMLRINPLLLLFFILLAMAGYVLSPTQPRLGSILFNTGYGVTAFLGAVGCLSLVFWSLAMNFHFRRLFPKVVFSALALFYFGGDWMTFAAILDSVLDFRNLSKKSPWRWIVFQLSRIGRKED